MKLSKSITIAVAPTTPLLSMCNCNWVFAVYVDSVLVGSGLCKTEELAQANARELAKQYGYKPKDEVSNEPIPNT